MRDKPTVLLIDDEERILRSLKIMLRADYKILSTSNPHEALDLLKNQTVHVIISDQRMPEMLGIELLRQARDISPNSMRLLLTGYSDLNAIIGSINEGEIYRFISKPWQQEELLKTVKEAAEIALSIPAISEEAATVTDNFVPTILVLDDDPKTHDIVRESVGDKVKIICHNNIHDGLETLANEPISILVSDLRLGNDDIRSAIQTLRQQNPHLITIVLTSFQDTSYLIDLINHGQIFRFLPKPARRGLLQPCFDSAIKRYQSFVSRPETIARQQPKIEETTEAPNSTGKKLSAYLSRIKSRQITRFLF
jgi:response regulator RpfG family c-di-GMP phosphodiesterase